jgi:hypothetical protein
MVFNGVTFTVSKNNIVTFKYQPVCTLNASYFEMYSYVQVYQLHILASKGFFQNVASVIFLPVKNVSLIIYRFFMLNC